MLIEDAIRYPLEGDHTRDAFLLGGTLGLSVFVLMRMAGTLWPSVLVAVPLVLAGIAAVGMLGYLVAVTDGVLSFAAGPPAIPEPGRLLVDGLRGGAVVVAYLTVPLGVTLVTVYGATTTSVEGPVGLETGSTLLLGSTVTLLVSLAFAYALPAAFVGAVREDDVRAAFSPSGLTHAMFDGAYFFAWVVGFVAVSVAWSLLLGAAVNHTILGVAAVFLAFYCHLIAVQAVGTGYLRAYGIRPGE